MTLIANRVAIVGEKRRGIANDGAIGHLPSYPDVLHDVLGLGGTAEHAVGPDRRSHSCRHIPGGCPVLTDVRRALFE